MPAEVIVSLYRTTILPLLEYSAQIFHHALPAFLSDDIERVPRRALSFISPELSYLECLNRHGLASIYDRRVKLCDNLFFTFSNPCHSLSCLLPETHHAAYNTRRQRVFNMSRWAHRPFQALVYSDFVRACKSRALDKIYTFIFSLLFCYRYIS